MIIFYHASVPITKCYKCCFNPISSNIPSFNFGYFNNNFVFNSLLEITVGKNNLIPNIFASFLKNLLILCMQHKRKALYIK